MIDWINEFKIDNYKELKQTLIDKDFYYSYNMRSSNLIDSKIKDHVNKLLKKIYEGNTIYNLKKGKWDSFKKIKEKNNLYLLNTDKFDDNIALHRLIKYDIKTTCFNNKTPFFSYEKNNFTFKDENIYELYSKILNSELLKNELIKIKCDTFCSLIDKYPTDLTSNLSLLLLTTDYWLTDISFLIKWRYNCLKPISYTFNNDNISEKKIKTLLDFQDDWIRKLYALEKETSPIYTYILEELSYEKNSIGITSLTLHNKECAELKFLLLTDTDIKRTFKGKKKTDSQTIQSFLNKLIKAEQTPNPLNYYMFEMLFGFNYCLVLCEIFDKFSVQYHNDAEILKLLSQIIEHLLSLSNIATRTLFAKELLTPLLNFVYDEKLIVEKALRTILKSLPEFCSINNDTLQILTEHFFLIFLHKSNAEFELPTYESIIQVFSQSVGDDETLKLWCNDEPKKYNCDSFNEKCYTEFQKKYLTFYFTPS